MDQTPISTPDQRKPRKEKAGQTGVGGDLINSIKGNKSIMRGRPKGQQVVTIVTQNDQEGILRYPVFAIVFCCSPQGGIYHEKRQLDKHLFNHQAFIQLSTIKHLFDHQLFNH